MSDIQRDSDDVLHQDAVEAVATMAATAAATDLLDGHVEEWDNDPIDDVNIVITDPPEDTEVREIAVAVNDILAALRNSGIIPPSS